MSELEMITLAAKAVGHKVKSVVDGCDVVALYLDDGRDVQRSWNPARNDGDALRLAVALGIGISQQARMRRVAAVWWGSEQRTKYIYADYAGDPCEATRVAIVGAAAEIGEAMQ